MEKGYDLHCHTIASDGNLDLEELVKLAQNCNLEGFAVTDHDILSASKKAKYIKEIEIIPGVELSGKLDKYLIELTGYFVNPFSKELEDACEINLELRRARVGKIIHKINEKYRRKLEKEITYDEVLGATSQKEGSVGLNHINKILINKKLFKGREAFSECLGRNSENSCYIERDCIDFDYAISAITDAGGVVGLPHPALISCEYPLLCDKEFFGLIRPYLGKQIKVVETDYPYKKARPEFGDLSEKEEFWRRVSSEYDLVGVGGSDGHQKPEGPGLGEKRTAITSVEIIRKYAS